MLIYDRKITISSAGSRWAKNWPAQTIYWSELIKKLRVPVRSTEPLVEYLKLPKAQQDDLKDVGGFVGGTLIEGRRKASTVATRDIITLDLDNIPAGGTADVLRRLDGLGCAYATYSTRKHEEARPRLRVLIPTDRSVLADEYEPIARKMAEIIGINLADQTTFEAHRLMYWPSCCSDSQYVFQFGDKPFLSADGILAMYRDWRNVAEWPEVPGQQQKATKLAAKQGDPLEKSGVVGAFCKAYDIYRAIEVFLPGVYEPVAGSSDRFTYTGGSTVGGAVVYDNGKFLCSHHATDPCSGRLVNAFDLVRLHKFGELDDEAKLGTPTNRLPSYEAMYEFAAADEQVALLLNQERYEKATQEFAASPDDDANWMKKLAVSSTTGLPAKTINNVLVILENDPLLKGKLAFDEFANRGMALGALPWNSRTERRVWEDADDAGLMHYLEHVYKIQIADKRMYAAMTLCAHKNRFNEVQEYLTSLKWDGIKRLDTLLIDYLGAEDNVYTRAVIRKSLAAAVARAMTPGCKYDYMPIFVGPQGIGKSTFLRILGRRWFSDSLQIFEGKEAAEMIQGVWINELGELNGLSRAETNAVKQFLSRTEDIYREPYGRRTGVYSRRCVFFGTTNDSEFLRDRTGNRRFWPVDVGLQEPTKNVFTQLEEEVDQIWAEAFLAWQLGEPLYLSGEAERISVQEQEAHRESNAKEGVIREFVERQVPTNWYKRSLSERRMYWSGEFKNQTEKTVPRDRICAAEIWCELFGKDISFMRRQDVIEINGILDNLPGWKKDKNARQFGRAYGHQRGYSRQISLTQMPDTSDTLTHSRIIQFDTSDTSDTVNVSP
ncbi:virulence-associated protein E [Thermanaerosceptrum fracticalcis]|uniref:Virulence-associated protein E n=1 Tax=Thermanaerosceptrum fracticalcis TaxID=1712410 RepID=A0A7G6E7Y7_THEFR|nr:virulence-associated E family protein [Thermanaerosceptrum fracticalcis]QNB48191.1 virulence-associated protein E [Thermanaerosceptrum fracticalcis]